MKKILLLVLAVSMLTSCSAKKTGESLKNRSASVVSEEQKGKEEKNEVKKEDAIARTMTDEEVLKELKGMYISCDYIENFKSTKSAVDSKDLFAAMIINDDQEQYGVMQMDGHQGSERSSVDKITYDGNGSYIVSFKASNRQYHPFDVDLKYTPGSSKIQCSVKTEAVMWKTDKKIVDFYKYADSAGIYYELSCSVFDGYTSTFVEPDRVGFEYEDETYTVEIIFDTVEEGSLTLDNADGYILITKDSTGDRTLGKYFCDGYVLRIFDADGNIFAEFRKPQL